MLLKKITITFFLFILTISGCVKKEIVRKAEWETDFTDLYFIDQRHGWIVGRRGIVIHTDDGGNTWVDLIGNLKIVVLQMTFMTCCRSPKMKSTQ